ncbi:MAG: metallophosphoesterase [Betaproteobacteria bacterium]|nr:metallophosphoesterase [Betaproteobacteria bacterium]
MAPAIAFTGDILLGAPEDTRVRVKLFSPTQSGTVQLSWGILSASESRGPVVALQAGEPLEVLVDGLQPDAAYRWKLAFTATGATGAVDSSEYRWRTARRPGSTYTFTIQADSHLDENSDLETYRRTLDNIPLASPDFHIDLGDTFMTEKYSEPLSAIVSPAPNATVVNNRYIQERGHFARIGHSVPVFLVNGNHDGELGWSYTGQAESLPIWATKARKRYFLNPLPGGFYSGDLNIEPYTGERAAWYAWRWGDAQFIVLDPFWNSRATANRDPWNITLGERQYRWLEGVLQSKTAAHTFVFIHNLVGGSAEGQMRGGSEAAPLFEWGGRNADGSPGFATKRPGWSAPIHDLLVRHKVTAVFHGHDHFYAHQVLDGVIYQLVPQPSARNSNNGDQLAADYRYLAGTFLASSGHLRVTVSPTTVTSEYVRTWLPTAQTATRVNGQVDHRWVVNR